MTRTTRIPPSPSASATAPLDHPAMMLMMSWSDLNPATRSEATSPNTCGLIARTIVSADATALRLLSIAVTPNRVSKSCRRSGTGSATMIWSGVQTPAPRTPATIPSAMFPPPTKPNA